MPSGGPGESLNMMKNWCLCGAEGSNHAVGADVGIFLTSASKKCEMMLLHNSDPAHRSTLHHIDLQSDFVQHIFSNILGS